VSSGQCGQDVDPDRGFAGGAVDASSGVVLRERALDAALAENLIRAGESGFGVGRGSSSRHSGRTGGHLGMMNAFALLRLLPMGDREKDVEILAATALRFAR
jgi:hypothetical protein